MGSPAQGGFTLVELLLAITLMSMLMALAYGGLRASARATDRGQTILEESGRIRMAHQFVRKQLNQMVPLVFMQDEQQQERTIFEGSADMIRFVGPMPGYLGFGGPQVQEMALVPAGDRGTALVLSHALLQGFEESRLYERAPIVLIDRIDQASFFFLGLTEEGELADWTSGWEDPTIMPLAVSLEMEFEEDVFTTWPVLTASVRIDSSALRELAEGENVNLDRRNRVRSLIDKRKKRN
jgi:general secretion pathway protein J